MNIKKYLFGLISTIIVLTSCIKSGSSNIADNSNTQIANSDSIELTTLVRNVYEWHETKYRRNGYPFKFKNPNDSIFIGVDWDKYEKEMDVFRNTNFFSKDFFITHKTIGLSIDSSIKQTDIEWRNVNDGISIWDTDADDWCGCQDYPDNYWKKITLNNISKDNGVVTFYWTWNNKSEKQYQMNARKEEGTWKINFIQGFSSYRTVADYKTIIKNCQSG